MNNQEKSKKNVKCLKTLRRALRYMDTQQHEQKPKSSHKKGQKSLKDHTTWTKNKLR